MKLNDTVNIIGLIGIAVSIAGMQQPELQKQLTCTVENIVAGESATVNINCTVAP